MARFFYGWVVVACAFTVLFLAYGVQYAFGVFVPAMADDLGWPHAVLGGVFSLYGTLYCALTMFAGLLTDRLGPRRVLSIGGLLLGTGLIATSQATAPWQVFLSYGVIAAFGMSTAYIPCNMTVVRWFRRRRGRALGLSSSGASCGILTIPVVAVLLIERAGWRVSLFALGTVLLVVTLLAARFMVREPAVVGLLPDGDDTPAAGPSGDGPNAPETPSLSFAEARRVPAFWLFILGFALALLTMTVPFVHIAQYALDLGLGPRAGAWAVSVIGFAALCGNLGFGRLAEYLGVKRAFLAGAAVQVLAYVLFWSADGGPALYAGAAAFGVFYGCFSSLFPAFVATLFGPNHAATIGGFIVGGGGLLGGWGPAAVGFLRDANGDYARALVVCAAVAVACFTLFASLRHPRGLPG